MIHYDSSDNQTFGIDIASYARFLKLSTTSTGYSLKKTIRTVRVTYLQYSLSDAKKWTNRMDIWQ